MSTLPFANVNISGNRHPVRVALGGAATDAARAEAAAATAIAAAGPNYASTAAGLAATTDGEAFAVDNGDGTVTIYLNDGGSAVAQRTLATTAFLASSAGAEQIGTPDGTVQENLDVLNNAIGIVARDVAGTSYTLLATDALATLRFTSSTAVTVTVPTGLPANFSCSLMQKGTGAVTVEADPGVTVGNADDQFTTQTQLVRLTLLPNGTNDYVLEGRTK